MNTSSCVEKPTEKLRCYETETNIFLCLLKRGYFQLAKSSDSVSTIPFKNRGFCVRALLCHQDNVAVHDHDDDLELSYNSYMTKQPILVDCYV